MSTYLDRVMFSDKWAPKSGPKFDAFNRDLIALEKTVMERAKRRALVNISYAASKMIDAQDESGGDNG